MLKYQVKPREQRSGVAAKLHRNSSLSMDTPPPRPSHRTLIHIRNGPPSCSTSSNSSGSMSDLTSPRSQTNTPPPAIRLRSTSLSSLSSIDSFDSADWVSFLEHFLKISIYKKFVIHVINYIVLWSLSKIFGVAQFELDPNGRPFFAPLIRKTHLD